MTTIVIALRPRPVLPSSPSSPVVPVPDVEWDDFRGLHIAHCARCTDTYTSPLLHRADWWADSHRCDLELVALLDQTTSGRAA
ncbi:hypothetical protein SMC26_24180 [Actinomadura fulvescens]|uniref:hypothetical protein n=1 Tax=Actinomadura fulvescens TaxID=46160 RepID=UPI0031E1DC05